MNNHAVYEKLTKKILEHLDKGTVPWQMPWARTPLEAPKNAQTAYCYTGGNRVWLSLYTYMSGFSHPLYLTMHQINTLNEAVENRLIHVRKGESGYPLIWFKEIEIDNPDGETDDNGNLEKVTIPMARHSYVWNVAQIAGLEPCDLPEYERRANLEPNTFIFTPIATVDDFIAAWNGIVPIEAQGERAFYRPATDMIRVPKPERFNSPAAYYTTLFHEMVHSTGHESRLNRDLSGSKMDEDYGREELVAEMGATYLAGILGVDPHFENSAAYITGWKQACTDDSKLLFWAASKAQEAVDYLLKEVGLLTELIPALP